MIRLRLRALHLSFAPRLDQALMIPEKGSAAEAIAASSVAGFVIMVPDRCRLLQRY